MLISKKNGKSGLVISLIAVIAVIMLFACTLAGCSDKEAVTRADAAQAAADAAKAAAELAQQAANDAKNAADKAQTDANAAQGTADAKTTAEEVTAAINQLLTKYATTESLGAYVTSEYAKTALAGYVDKETLKGYIKAADASTLLAQALGEYVSIDSLNGTLAGYVKNESLDIYAKNETLDGYVKIDDVDELLTEKTYVKAADLTEALRFEIEKLEANYYTSAKIDKILESYMTSDALTTTLLDYAKSADVAEDMQNAKTQLLNYIGKDYDAKVKKNIAAAIALALDENIDITTENKIVAYMEANGIENADALVANVIGKLAQDLKDYALSAVEEHETKFEAATELGEKKLDDINAAMIDNMLVAYRYDTDEMLNIMNAATHAEFLIYRAQNVEDVETAYNEFIAKAAAEKTIADKLYAAITDEELYTTYKVGEEDRKTLIVDLSTEDYGSAEKVAEIMDYLTALHDIMDSMDDVFEDEVKNYKGIIDLETAALKINAELEALRIARDEGCVADFQLASTKYVYDATVTYYVLADGKYTVVATPDASEFDTYYVLDATPVTMYIDYVKAALKLDANNKSQLTKADVAGIAALDTAYMAANKEYIDWGSRNFDAGYLYTNPNEFRIVNNYEYMTMAYDLLMDLMNIGEQVDTYKANITEILEKIRYSDDNKCSYIYEKHGMAVALVSAGNAEKSIQNLKNEIHDWAIANNLVQGDDETRLNAVITNYQNLIDAISYAEEQKTYFDKADQAYKFVEKMDAAIAAGMIATTDCFDKYDAAVNMFNDWVDQCTNLDDQNKKEITNDIDTANFTIANTNRYDYFFSVYAVRMNALKDAVIDAKAINGRIDAINIDDIKVTSQTLIETLDKDIADFYTDYAIVKDAEAEGYISDNYELINNAAFKLLKDKYDGIMEECTAAVSGLVRLINNVYTDGDVTLYQYVSMLDANKQYYAWANKYGVVSLAFSEIPDFVGEGVLEAAYNKMITVLNKGENETYANAKADYTTGTTAYTAFFAKFTTFDADNKYTGAFDVYSQTIIKNAYDAANGWFTAYLNDTLKFGKAVNEVVDAEEKTVIYTNDISTLADILTEADYAKICSVNELYNTYITAENGPVDSANDIIDNLAPYFTKTGDAYDFNITIFAGKTEVLAVKTAYETWIATYAIDYANTDLDTRIVAVGMKQFEEGDLKACVDFANEMDNALNDFNTNVTTKIALIIDEEITIYGNTKIADAEAAYKTWADKYLAGNYDYAIHTEKKAEFADCVVYETELAKITTANTTYQTRVATKNEVKANLETQIDNIATPITTDSKTAIEAAEATYDKWLDNDNDVYDIIVGNDTFVISNYAKLTAARADYNTLLLKAKKLKIDIESLSVFDMPEDSDDPAVDGTKYAAYKTKCEEVRAEYNAFIASNGENRGMITTEEVQVIIDAENFIAQQAAIYRSNLVYKEFVGKYTVDPADPMYDKYQAIISRFTTTYNGDIANIRATVVDATNPVSVENVMNLAKRLYEELNTMVTVENTNDPTFIIKDVAEYDEIGVI